MKRIKAFVSALTAAFLVLSLFPVFASPAEYTVNCADDWNALSRLFRTDKSSRGAKVTLEADVSGDLSPIPFFDGEFYGNGHTLSCGALSFDTDISGLFRIVGESGVVRDLTVSGSFEQGERETCALLCGENRGHLINCKTSGYVAARNIAGGLCALNLGRIENCENAADVEGFSSVGGICGINRGVLRECANTASLTLATDGSSISVSSFLNGQSENAAQNIGGVCGENEGDVISCVNRGKVGYPHTGYNVGGVCGINRGFISICENHAEVSGRRDVGGVVGQAVPSYSLSYGESSLKLLSNSAGDLISALASTSDGLDDAYRNGTGDISGILSELDGISSSLDDDVKSLLDKNRILDETLRDIDKVENDLERITRLLPKDSGEAKLISEITALLKDLKRAEITEWGGILSKIFEKLELLNLKLASRAQNLPSTLRNYNEIKALINQTAADLDSLAKKVLLHVDSVENDGTALLTEYSKKISSLINRAEKAVADSEKDGSSVHESADKVIEEVYAVKDAMDEALSPPERRVDDLSLSVASRADGLIDRCKNDARTDGDINVGGIVGNMSFELSSDPEEDFVSEEDGLLFRDASLSVRATVNGCENSGDVYAKYDCSGGILGSGTRGAVVSCENRGNAESGRNFAGGVAGRFTGDIKDCLSISYVKAEAYAGGIAGDAENISDSLACVTLHGSVPFSGGVAGSASGDLKNNFFECENAGGVNDISYEGAAEETDHETLLLKSRDPSLFAEVFVNFVNEDGGVTVIKLPYGGRVTDIPQNGVTDGNYWRWDDFDETDVRHNQTVHGERKRLISTLSSGGEIPQFLVEGNFEGNSSLSVSPRRDLANEDGVSAYTLTATGGGPLKVRFLSEKDGELQTEQNGKLSKASYTRDGRYIVFGLENGGSFVFTEKEPRAKSLPMILACVSLVAALAAILTVEIKRRKS